MTNKKRILIVIGIGLVGAIVLLFVPPIPQNPAYHHLADTRRMLGINNFLNVASNIPFLIVGIMGLQFFFRAG